MNIAIVILNWNGQSLLERFLPTVIKYSEEHATIYVADNASTDNSIAYLKEHFPSVKIIQNEENGGYAKGYNDALASINAELFVLLNNDVEVTAGWLPPMIALFDDPNVAAAQPKIKNLNAPSQFEYAGAAGGYLDQLGYPYCRGRIFDTCEKDNGQYDDTVSIQWASGASLFVRAFNFWEAGGLDPLYFAHQEEIDLCWRIRNRGYSILACGSSEVYHLGGGTLDMQNPKKTYYNFRNTLFSIVKNVKGIKALFIVIARLILDGVAGIKFLLQGRPKFLMAILKAHIHFYKNLTYLLERRLELRDSKPYAHLVSIVWSYYVLKKKRFKDL